MENGERTDCFAAGGLFVIEAESGEGGWLTVTRVGVGVGPLWGNVCMHLPGTNLHLTLTNPGPFTFRA